MKRPALMRGMARFAVLGASAMGHAEHAIRVTASVTVFGIDRRFRIAPTESAPARKPTSPMDSTTPTAFGDSPTTRIRRRTSTVLIIRRNRFHSNLDDANARKLGRDAA